MFKWISSFLYWLSFVYILYPRFLHCFFNNTLFPYSIFPLCRFSMHSQLTYLSSPDHEKLYCFKIYGDFESMLTAWRAYNDCFPPFFFHCRKQSFRVKEKKNYIIFMYMYAHFFFLLAICHSFFYLWSFWTTFALGM